MSSSPTSGSRRSTVASALPLQRSGADQQSTGLWKLTSCGKLLRTFPQDLENASRFPHLPQPLPATRKREIEGVSCPSTGVHHVPGHLSTMSPVQTRAGTAGSAGWHSRTHASRPNVAPHDDTCFDQALRAVPARRRPHGRPPLASAIGEQGPRSPANLRSDVEVAPLACDRDRALPPPRAARPLRPRRALLPPHRHRPRRRAARSVRACRLWLRGADGRSFLVLRCSFFGRTTNNEERTTNNVSLGRARRHARPPRRLSD